MRWSLSLTVDCLLRYLYQCDMSELEGSFEINYDFYRIEAGGYLFSGSAALTFTGPTGGDGVMAVNYCFGGDNSNDMVAVQTGFVKNSILPIKIVKYEDTKSTDKIYNEYSFSGEYNCATQELILGFTSYFEGNAFTTAVSTKDDGLELNGSGCLAD